MSNVLSLDRLRLLHWWICAVIAVVSSSSTVLLDLPICLGCLFAQSLFWLRLFIKTQSMIALNLLLCSGILAILWFQSLHPSLTCPFDLTQNIPSCTHLSQDFLWGYPLAAWGCVGSFLLSLWAYADFLCSLKKRAKANP